jgi:hypothetical protein
VGASLFFTLSLLTYHEYVTRRNTLFLGANMVLGLCAMFTKEQGVTVFAVCMVYELVAHSSRGPTTMLRVLLGMSHRKLSKTAEVSVITKTKTFPCLQQRVQCTGVSSALA